MNTLCLTSSAASGACAAWNGELYAQGHWTVNLISCVVLGIFALGLLGRAVTPHA